VADEHPDYGPRGYLPPRAAKRARKIILREPMGLHWAVAAAVAGVLVLVAGGVLLSRTGPPGPPFVAVGGLEQVDPGGAGDLPVGDGRDVLVLRGAGGVTVFAAPDVPVAWCAPRSRLIGGGTAVWQPDGRLVGGTGDSLARLPAQVHDGVLYVDAVAAGTRAKPDPRGESDVCPTS
jgi:hypothetical protein